MHRQQIIRETERIKQRIRRKLYACDFCDTTPQPVEYLSILDIEDLLPKQELRTE